MRALLGRAGERRVLDAFADAIADYSEAAKGGETRESAQAMLGQGQCWFALKKWEDAARCFLKVDVLYGFDELKPEALAMAARCWEQAGDTAKTHDCGSRDKCRSIAKRHNKRMSFSAGQKIIRCAFGMPVAKPANDIVFATLEDRKS